MGIDRLLILTFIITALYDILLRYMSLNYDKLPAFFKWFDFIKYLTPYFKKHTLLSAALLAGFIGFGAQLIILTIMPYPNVKKINLHNIITFFVITFIVSALYGLPMKASKLFPILDETYYKGLGTFRGLYHDGISGLIVQFTLLILLYIYEYYK
jgi:hypothetical protein